MLVLLKSLLASFKSYLMKAKKNGEADKIELFFEKFRCESLNNEIIAYNFDFHRNGGTFSDTANFMDGIVKPVSQSQKFGRNQNISAMGTTHTGTAPSAGIYIEDGTIFAGKYGRDHFQIFSREEMESLYNSPSKHGSSNTKGGNRKIKATKRKSELTFKKLTKELKESRRTLLALQASTAPTVSDTPKATPTPDVSGAGTEMTLYAAGTQMGRRASRCELLIGRSGIWIGVNFRVLLLILKSIAHLY